MSRDIYACTQSLNCVLGVIGYLVILLLYILLLIKKTIKQALSSDFLNNQSLWLFDGYLVI